MNPSIAAGARRVRVGGREEVGIVIDEGKNFGTISHIYCAGVYFPKTGEVAYYEKGRELPTED